MADPTATTPIGPIGNPDEWAYLNEQGSDIVDWAHEVPAEDASLTRHRRHKALCWVATVCFSDSDSVDGALKQWHTDPEFHARCELLAQMVGQLANGRSEGSDG